MHGEGEVDEAEGSARVAFAAGRASLTGLLDAS